MKEQPKDHTPLEQAFASAHILSEEQKRKLIQDKFQRARHLSEQLKRTGWWRQTT